MTAVPAIHFSKRGLFDRNATLWAGYLIEAGGRRLLFSGDIGPDETTFHEEPRAPADVDVLLVESTYGDRDREDVTVEQRRARLGQEIRDALAYCRVTIQHDDDLAFERMRGHGIEIVSREMVAFEWLQRGGTELFREVNRDFIR